MKLHGPCPTIPMKDERKIVITNELLKKVIPKV